MKCVDLMSANTQVMHNAVHHDWTFLITCSLEKVLAEASELSYKNYILKIMKRGEHDIEM